MLSEFKEFAMKGNLVDLAVGVVMGAAFGKVVDAFIGGMVMPLVGLLTGGKDFSKLMLEISPEVKDAAGKITQEAVNIKWGEFVTVLINFLVVAWVVFMLLKAMNAAKKKEAEAPPPPPPAQEVLLGEIRDLLSKR